MGEWGDLLRSKLANVQKPLSFDEIQGRAVLGEGRVLAYVTDKQNGSDKVGRKTVRFFISGRRGTWL